MTIYDEIEIEDLDFDQRTGTFFYDCPCGDKFRITLRDLKGGQDIAECPSCSLLIKIIFEPEDLEEFRIMPKKILITA